MSRADAKAHNFAILYGMDRSRAEQQFGRSFRFGGSSRLVKRAWKRAGTPASLKAWARAMAPWEEACRAWLGQASCAPPIAPTTCRRGPNAARPPSRKQRAGHGYRLIVDDPYLAVPGWTRKFKAAVTKTFVAGILPGLAPAELATIIKEIHG